MGLLRHFTAGMPQLDIHTLAEEWALAYAMESTWMLLAESLGKPPTQWLDAAGGRMYGAVMAIETRFDLDHPVLEDDIVAAQTDMTAVRKPHAIALTSFAVAGQVRAEARVLTSFIRRDQPGSNKKFSKVRDVWTAPDLDPDAVDDWLERHHAAKSFASPTGLAMQYEINRLQDFNAADFLYFKNFVRIARAAEWRNGRQTAPELVAHRQGFYFGNVEDGEVIDARIDRQDGLTRTALLGDDGRTLFCSTSLMRPVAIRPR
ncbi:MAG: LnmK family bifunctional acyltransferase/decarboxylase [bacterium]